MALSKVNAGEPFKPSAARENALVEAANWVNAQRYGLGADMAAGRPRDGTALVRNTTGGDLDRFAIVQLDGPTWSPYYAPDQFAEAVALDVIAPRFADWADVLDRRLAILEEPIAAGASGLAIVVGITAATVTLTKPWHWRAEAAAGDCSQLYSADDGPVEILWTDRNAGGGPAYVRLPAAYDTTIWGRITAHTSIGPNQWRYDFRHVRRADTGTGYGTWQNHPSGLTGVAYNSIEDPNDGAGEEGNGVTVGSGLVLLPLGLNAVTRIYPVPYGLAAPPSVEFWFAAENEYDFGSG